MHYLYIKPLEGKHRRVTLPKGATTIGRDPDNGVVVEEYGVSGHHVLLDVSAAEVLLRDLESTNGTFVNGKRVSEVRLRPGDRILLGSVLLVLQEALSDRLLVRSVGDGAEGASDVEPGGPETPSGGRAAAPWGGRAYVPAAEDRPGTADSEANLLALVRDVLRDAGGPVGERLQRPLDVLVRSTGARGGRLLGRRPGAGLVVVAASGEDDGGRLAPSVLERVLDTGVPVCVEPSEAGKEPAGMMPRLCVPLSHGGRSAGILELSVPGSALAEARRRAEGLGTVLSVLALLIQRDEAEDALEKTASALAAGAEIAVASWATTFEEIGFVATSRSMAETTKRLERAAPLADPVLLRGESGTGKRRAARHLHATSRRRGEPFLAVNCATADVLRLDEELFGAPDAGQAQARRGKLELAGRGTLFLDEVTQLPQALQRRLLLALEMGEVPPADGGPPVPHEARVVASTRRDMDELVADGRFVPELAERLGRHTIVLPPLRDRREDVVPLAQAFARRDAAELHKRIVGLSMDACRALRDHEWKGNVRELENVICRAVVLAEDEILDVDLLPLDISAGRLHSRVFDNLFAPSELSWREAKVAFERAYFEDILAKYEGNITRSSRKAGIARKSFYYKLRQLGLAHDPPTES